MSASRQLRKRLNGPPKQESIDHFTRRLAASEKLILQLTEAVKELQRKYEFMGQLFALHVAALKHFIQKGLITNEDIKKEIESHSTKGDIQRPGDAGGNGDGQSDVLRDGGSDQNQASTESGRPDSSDQTVGASNS